MTYEEFRDIQCKLDCENCKYHKPNADIVESECKRLDHKHFCFSKNPFSSYHCKGRICADFEPKEWQKWLCANWKKEFINDYGNEIKDDDLISFCIDKNFDVRYQLRYKDFFDNNFIKDNELLWLRKGYYKRSKKSPIGYIYVYEYKDGAIKEGANIGL